MEFDDDTRKNPWERPVPYDPDEYRHSAQARVVESEFEKPQKSFWALLPMAFVFPLVGRGRMMLVAGSIFFSILSFLARWSIFGIVAAAFAVGYLSAYMSKVIGAVAAGYDVPPDWPDFANVIDDVLRPLVLVLGAFLTAFFPIVLFLFVYFQVVDTEFAEFVLDPPTSFLVMIVLSLLYMPMSLLTVALWDSIDGLNPWTVIVGIVRVAPAYIVVCIVLAVAICLRYLFTIGTLLLVDTSTPFSDCWLRILLDIVDGAVSLYFLMAEMYVLGILYRGYEKRLNWFTVD